MSTGPRVKTPRSREKCSQINLLCWLNCTFVRNFYLGIALEYAGKISQGSSGYFGLSKPIKQGRVEGLEG
jgi:hypothetical protein